MGVFPIMHMIDMSQLALALYELYNIIFHLDRLVSYFLRKTPNIYIVIPRHVTGTLTYDKEYFES